MRTDGGMALREVREPLIGQYEDVRTALATLQSRGDLVNRTRATRLSDGRIRVDITRRVYAPIPVPTVADRMGGWVVEHKKGLLVTGGVTSVVGGVGYGIYYVVSAIVSAIASNVGYLLGGGAVLFGAGLLALRALSGGGGSSKTFSGTFQGRIH